MASAKHLIRYKNNPRPRIMVFNILTNLFSWFVSSNSWQFRFVLAILLSLFVFYSSVDSSVGRLLMFLFMLCFGRFVASISWLHNSTQHIEFCTHLIQNPISIEWKGTMHCFLQCQTNCFDQTINQSINYIIN